VFEIKHNFVTDSRNYFSVGVNKRNADQRANF